MDKQGAPVIVRMEQVVKQFGDFIALKNVDLSVQEGEVVVIIGLPVPASPLCCAPSTSWECTPAAGSWSTG